jgi:hypothetical protein
MKVGDIWYVGSRLIRNVRVRYPALIIEVDARGCTAVVDGNIRWYRQRDLSRSEKFA